MNATVILYVLLLLAMCVTVDMAGLEIRVSPALLSHPPRTVRLSLIDTSPSNVTSFFDYNSQFQFAWRNLSLHSTLVSIPVGKPAVFQINGQAVRISLPSTGAGTRGIIFGDPCVHITEFSIPCVGDMATRLPVILNSVASQLDWWSILGDNFYDRHGGLSQGFFNSLSLDIKQVPLITVHGNHDYWLFGTPSLGMSADQLGNGLVQYYGQDVMAGKANPKQPYNWSAAPPKLTHVANTFQYKVVGDVAFIGYSAAYSWAELQPYFIEACAALAAQSSVRWSLLIGHWSFVNDGAQTGMDTKSIQQKLQGVAGCQKLIAVYGHTHCNIMEGPNQFLIGASGFPMVGCNSGDIGVVYWSTQNARLLVVLFPLGNTYDAVKACLGSRAIDSCVSLGQVWVNRTA